MDESDVATYSADTEVNEGKIAWLSRQSWWLALNTQGSAVDLVRSGKDEHETHGVTVVWFWHSPVRAALELILDLDFGLSSIKINIHVMTVVLLSEC